MAGTTEEIIAMLKKAYSMELETVTNYLANSINLDGVRAEEIKKRHFPIEPEEMRRLLGVKPRKRVPDGAASRSVTLILTRIGQRPHAFVCERTT